MDILDNICDSIILLVAGALLGVIIGGMIFCSSNSDIVAELDEVKQERDTYRNIIVERAVED